MSENKKLNDGELEKVAGGETYANPDDIEFLYGLGYHVEVRTFKFLHQFTSGGRITKRGFTHVKGVFSPCYFIDCDDVDVSGWYDEDYLQDSTYTSWKKVSATVMVVD